MDVAVRERMRPSVQRGIAGQLAVQLEEPGVPVELEVVPLVLEVFLRQLGRADEVGVHSCDQLGHGRGIRLCRAANVHAGTSSSRASAK